MRRRGPRRPARPAGCAALRGSAGTGSGGPCAPPARAAARLDEVQVDGARVERREGVAELPERAHLHTRRDLEHPRLHEVERLAEAEHDARHGAQLREVVVDQAHHLGAQAFEVREVLRVDDAELLAEDAVAHLDRGPGGEVVRVRAGEAALAEAEAVGVEIDAVHRHLLQVLEELALVEGATAEHIAELPAAVEVKGRPRRPLVHRAAAPGASGAIRRRSHRRVTGSAERTAGGASRHHASARTWARPRSSTTAAASARSSRPSASWAPSGSPTIRSSRAWARRRASQRAGNTTPRARRDAARDCSGPSAGGVAATPAAISSAASYPSSGARMVRSRANAPWRLARATLAPSRATASTRCSRCTPKRLASVKRESPTWHDGVPSAARTATTRSADRAPVASSATRTSASSSPPAGAAEKPSSYPGTRGGWPSTARSAPLAATRAGVAARPRALRR